MESQLQDLIDLIKAEGIEQAEKEAQQIREQARAEAKAIVQDAREEAERMRVNATYEKNRFEEAGKKALQQAGRNLLIALRGSVISFFDNLIKKDLGKALDGPVLVSMLEKIAQNWRHESHQGLEILLSTSDLQLLQNEYLHKLQDEFRHGVTVKPVENVDKGFFIGESNENIYYDFTDSGLAEMISQYLNPQLSAIFQEQHNT